MRNRLGIIIVFIFFYFPFYGQRDILLKDYRPESIYKIPVTSVEKSKFSALDSHSHVYPVSEEEIIEWDKTMERAGIEKTILLTGYTGSAFDSIVNLYNRHSKRFEFWCGLDFSDYKNPGFIKKTLKELERCKKAGASGVGEITDKGVGVYMAFQNIRLDGIHLNSREMSEVFQKCAELGMPVNVHVADPYWMYLPVDEKNDGLMNAATWKIDLSIPNMRTHEELIAQFSEAVRKHPSTLFVACHFMNCTYDLSILGKLLDECSNLYVDISARLAETGSIPRCMNRFYNNYADRILYGTDNGTSLEMYQTTFRFLETEDEHFYVPSFGYHWNFSALGLSDDILKKVYYDNPKRIFKQK